MRPSERLKIISDISAELQSRYTQGEIDTYMGAFDIDVPEHWAGPNSKRVYSAELLKSVSDNVPGTIADDLGLSVSAAAFPLPRIWADTDEIAKIVVELLADDSRTNGLMEVPYPNGDDDVPF